MAIDTTKTITGVTYNGTTIPLVGITPTGKITINANGTDIDVSQYALADVNVSGGRGQDLDTPFVKYSVVDVTVGANTINNGFDATKYFAAAVGGNLVSYSILSNPSVYNEAVLQAMWASITSMAQFGARAYRWRNGINTSAFNNSNYDTVLVEGTTYRCVFVEADISDPQPY